MWICLQSRSRFLVQWFPAFCLSLALFSGWRYLGLSCFLWCLSSDIVFMASTLPPIGSSLSRFPSVLTIFCAGRFGTFSLGRPGQMYLITSGLQSSSADRGVGKQYPWCTIWTWFTSGFRTLLLLQTFLIPTQHT